LSNTHACHDPRISTNRDQKIETKNPALIAAEQSLLASSGCEINWDVVAAMADRCDQDRKRWPSDATRSRAALPLTPAHDTSAFRVAASTLSPQSAVIWALLACPKS
jgi:hypothetical protein